MAFGLGLPTPKGQKKGNSNMSNIELINKRRKHIVDAKLESMMRKTNSHCVIVSLKDGGMLYRGIIRESPD